MPKIRHPISKEMRSKVFDIMEQLKSGEDLAKNLEGRTLTFEFHDQDVAWYVAYKTMEA